MIDGTYAIIAFICAGIAFVLVVLEAVSLEKRAERERNRRIRACRRYREHIADLEAEAEALRDKVYTLQWKAEHGDDGEVYVPAGKR